jgi:hypothetical protein
MKSETRRLNKLTGASKNIAKRYKLTTAAAEIIDQAGEVHGQKSRAVQIAVELLWRTVGLGHPPCAMRGKSHRTIDPDALKIPAPKGRNLH